MGWLGIHFDVIFTYAVMALGIGWVLFGRRRNPSLSSGFGEKATAYPSVWLVLGISSFLLPVFAYWLSAHSHPNAIAGFLPWNDAAGYFECSEKFLLGADGSSGCSKRPFYIALFTSFLWITGNYLQFTLLLQAAVLGGAVALFLRAISDDVKGPAVLASYAVMFLFAAKYCAALVMTENAGLLLGCLGLALLWYSTSARHQMVLFSVGMIVLAAALNSRAGAMLVLPCALGWALFHSKERLTDRVIMVAVGLLATIVGLTISSLPTLIIDGDLGDAQSNFSYSLYGLVVGGKGWLQVKSDYPEIFSQASGMISTEDLIYRAAFKSILEQPHLFAFGYAKGLVHYFYDLFKFAREFAVLRYVLFMPLWAAGVWIAAARWREKRYALLLWLQVGILISSPFITFDGGNRVYAATMPLDALFVGLGAVWYVQLANAAVSIKNKKERSWPLGSLSIALMSVLLPIVTLIAIRLNTVPVKYASPQCETEVVTPVVVQPNHGSLALPLVGTGDETLFPLRVNADHLATRYDRHVHNAFEFRRQPGTTIVWGFHVDADQYGQPIKFVWSGDELTSRQAVGVCVTRPDPSSGRNIGNAVETSRAEAVQ